MQAIIEKRTGENLAADFAPNSSRVPEILGCSAGIGFTIYPGSKGKRAMRSGSSATEWTSVREKVRELDMPAYFTLRLKRQQCAATNLRSCRPRALTRRFGV